ncbi:glutaredoxin 2 [Vibrio viridaestus]|uniref:Glutaredoxin 2 n=1 Tax=Vibrio viridaestus TaxID=2487322 RepID=A0A3N9TKE8_9VIBR|nr:glutaredoxin 2 [Vibrio viridaestus]RQW64747.1 glutaredoxin 2 [Vibrio viridaestus]
MKLFVFEHCPFCIKAMMTANFKKLDVEFEYIQNHDVDARIEKVGANMVPIVQKPDGSYMAESLDIVKYFDEFNGEPTLLPGQKQAEISAWNQSVAGVEGPLVHPRWMHITLPEFGSAEAKAWFTKNKSAMISMSFEDAIAKTDIFLPKMNQALESIDFLTLPSENGNQLSYDDVNFYPTLRNLTVIKGIKFPPRVKQYVDEVTALTQIPVYYDVAV